MSVVLNKLLWHPVAIEEMTFQEAKNFASSQALRLPTCDEVLHRNIGSGQYTHIWTSDDSRYNKPGVTAPVQCVETETEYRIRKFNEKLIAEISD